MRSNAIEIYHRLEEVILKKEVSSSLTRFSMKYQREQKNDD